MKSFLILILFTAMAPGEYMLFNFDTPEKSGKWITVNDGVMGGVSESGFEINDLGHACFSGIVLPDNNGGFASVRAKVEIDSNEAYKGVKIRVKGDGKKYNLRFRTDSYFDNYAYQAKFPTTQNNWIEVELPFAEFTPTFRGRTLNDKPALLSENIRQIGILVADKQFGNFELHIDWIKLYK